MSTTSPTNMRSRASSVSAQKTVSRLKKQSTATPKRKRQASSTKDHRKHVKTRATPPRKAKKQSRCPLDRSVKKVKTETKTRSQTIARPVVDEDLAMCCVCGHGDSEDQNPIVFCDGCNIAVHKGCYGNPLANEIPKGDWLCERCLWKAQDQRCVLCPVKEGAMKRTTDWQWAHIACALWIPEVFCHYGDGLEPIDYFQVPDRRFALTCEYCGLKEGACAECAHDGCKVKFHICCGLKQKTKIVCEHKEEEGDKTDLILAFCSNHADAAKKMRGKKVKYYVSGR